MTADGENVTLSISLGSYGVSSVRNVDTNMRREQWRQLSREVQDDYAKRWFNQALESLVDTGWYIHQISVDARP